MRVLQAELLSVLYGLIPEDCQLDAGNTLHRNDAPEREIIEASEARAASCSLILMEANFDGTV